MTATLDILANPSFWAAALRIATPLIFGVLGALLCERAGVLNLGIEGIFVAGAMAGWLSVYLGLSLWGGVAVAALTGAAFGLLHAILTVPLGLSQHVTGIGVTLLATSMSYFGYRVAFPSVTSPPRITPFQPLDPGPLRAIPVLGEVLAQQTALTWLAIGLVVVLGYVLARTPLGLALRACGDNPAAVESQGLSVTALRMGAVMAGSALMALGGAFLTMSAFNAFFFGMIGGRGWVCIALTVFASWRPGKALLGALLFGAFDAFQVRLQTVSGGVAPSQVFLMVPYALSILALLLVARRADYPRALMQPYFRGQR
ncbi:ABC transporter permease [Alsobacter sp. SYSU M60028]|uniref:ABC transporter permease n=1 Tax=Alsobacter ponti TaxID=2962936 RepID=A0ABT1L6Z5_9HYPH|nr:ABC transporter permease [Alsobacter ponti]MCP8937089.1 ABC transporter permease [Alsobacter ponti]